MSKESRRPSRRHREGRRKKTAVEITAGGGLKLVIATAPQSDIDGPSVKDDVRLVRSALLYADQVELISPGALMLTSFALAAESGIDLPLNVLASLDEQALLHVSGGDDAAKVRHSVETVRMLSGLSRSQRRQALGPQRSRELASMLDEMAGKFLDGERGFRTTASKVWEQAGAPDLAVAAEAGLLTLSSSAFGLETDSKVQIEQYVETLKRLLADPTSHLIFDEQVGGLVAAMMREDEAQVHPLTAQHGVRATTGTGLIERLPAFPDAPIESILDTRAQLSEPLVRYRRGITGLADRLSSDATDPALQVEITDLWRDEVQPTLVTLRSELSRTRLVKDTAFKLATDAKAIVSGATGTGMLFGVGSITELAALSTTGATIAGGLVAQAAAQTIRDASSARKAARQHDLYYLLAANNTLR